MSHPDENRPGYGREPPTSAKPYKIMSHRSRVVVHPQTGSCQHRKERIEQGNLAKAVRLKNRREKRTAKGAVVTAWVTTRTTWHSYANNSEGVAYFEESLSGFESN